MGRIIKLQIPPGAYRNGTEYETMGRWRDVNLVRWREGYMLPVKGFTPVETALLAGVSSSFAVRGAIGWKDNAGTGYALWGTRNSVDGIDDTDTIFTPTPAGLTAGIEDATASQLATTWSWSTFGQIPIGCSDADGRLWEWDLNTANDLTQVTNSPTGCSGVLVTQERFVWALGDGGDERSIRWSDREDRTVWTAAVTNQAGGYDLETEGQIMFAKQLRNEVLIVTSRDCYRAIYVGYPDVYVFERVGDCSAVGRLCGVTVDDRAFWLGDNGFYQYQAGYVARLPCSISDFFFGDWVEAQKSKITTWHNELNREVWWLYESGSSLTDVDRYVAYNYEEGWWSYGVMGARTITNVPFANPYGFHEDIYYETNGTFAADTDWTKGTNWQIAGGVANQSAPSASALTQTITGLTANSALRVGFTVANRTAGSLTATLSPGTGSVVSSANGSASGWITPTSASAVLTFTADGVWDGDLDGVTLASANLKVHETGNVHDTTPYAETGPLEVAPGERRVHVTRVYPDEQDAAELSITFKTREYPTATQTTLAAVTAANPTDVRFSGRQFNMRVAPATANTDWRSGAHRLEITEGGRR